MTNLFYIQRQTYSLFNDKVKLRRLVKNKLILYSLTNLIKFKSKTYSNPKHSSKLILRSNTKLFFDLKLIQIFKNKF